MPKDTQIQRWVAPTPIIRKLRALGPERIYCPPHVFFRFSDKQRRIFNETSLKKILLEKWPNKVGLQYNRRYALFYRYKRHQFRRVMVEIKENEAWVITFYILDSKQLPNVIK